MDIFLEELLKHIEIDSFYIHGSYATGHHNDQSDIDYLVVLDSINEEIFTDLEHFHKQMILKNNLYSQVEGSYISKTMQANKDKPSHARIYYNDSQLKWAKYGDEWYFERSTLNSSAIIMYGNNRYLIQDVDKDDLKKAAKGLLNDNWLTYLNQAYIDDKYLDYGLQTLPRIIYTLKTGDNISKADAQKYIKGKFEDKDRLSLLKAYIKFAKETRL